MSRELTIRLGRAHHVLVAVALTAAQVGAAVAADSDSAVIELDETVISGNQELPKVLYIVPWQQPEGAPSLELRPESTTDALFRRLYPPAYRRELSYREAVDPRESQE